MHEVEDEGIREIEDEEIREYVNEGIELDLFCFEDVISTEDLSWLTT